MEKGWGSAVMDCTLNLRSPLSCCFHFGRPWLCFPGVLTSLELLSCSCLWMASEEGTWSHCGDVSTRFADRVQRY